uniref:Uncharacterized protein n=1 Tax=Physcomitrium patens TaxID=3218 RepID=A0A2K1KW12_PHYPA|nr:hypothetical protein PHYPA_004968 [Physcomitrium patens]
MTLILEAPRLVEAVHCRCCSRWRRHRLACGRPSPAVLFSFLLEVLHCSIQGANKSRLVHVLALLPIVSSKDRLDDNTVDAHKQDDEDSRGFKQCKTDNGGQSQNQSKNKVSTNANNTARGKRRGKEREQEITINTFTPISLINWKKNTIVEDVDDWNPNSTAATLVVVDSNLD